MGRRLNISKDWLEDQYLKQGKSAAQIAKILSCTESGILYNLHKHNVPVRHYGKREKSANWKGGRIKKSGYWTVLSPEHPRAQKGYVLEQIIVMEKYLGRFVTTEERIHHINFKKDDNRIENLLLCKSNSQHSTIHNSLQKLNRELYEKGLIIFDKKEGVYKVSV